MTNIKQCTSLTLPPTKICREPSRFRLHKTVTVWYLQTRGPKRWVKAGGIQNQNSETQGRSAATLDPAAFSLGANMRVRTPRSCGAGAEKRKHTRRMKTKWEWTPNSLTTYCYLPYKHMLSFNSRARPVRWMTSDLSGPDEPASKSFIIKSAAFFEDLSRESHIYWLQTENQGESSHPNQSPPVLMDSEGLPHFPVAYILSSVITGMSSKKKRSIYPQFRFENTNCDSTEKNHILQFIRRH